MRQISAILVIVCFIFVFINLFVSYSLLNYYKNRAMMYDYDGDDNSNRIKVEAKRQDINPKFKRPSSQKSTTSEPIDISPPSVLDDEESTGRDPIILQDHTSNPNMTSTTSERSPISQDYYNSDEYASEESNENINHDSKDDYYKDDAVTEPGIHPSQGRLRVRGISPKIILKGRKIN